MPRLPDLEAMAIFARVAEHGSFSAAAADLALSKATVSKAVTRLERALSAALFHRTSRRLSLTETGRVTLVRAQRILAEGEAAIEEAADRAERPRGTVRLAVPMSFGVTHVAPLLPEFLARYPDVAVDIRFGDRRSDLIAEGIDVALRIGTLDDSSLRARRLAAVRRPLVASPGFVRSHGSPDHPRALDGFPAIVFSHLHTPALWRFHHPVEGEATVQVDGPLKLDNGDAALPALCAGVGMALMPDFLVWEELRAGRLVELLAQWAPEPTALHLVTPPGAIRPARVTALIDYLADRLRHPPWASMASGGR